MTRTGWVVGATVWLFAVGYMAAHFDRGWVPHDDGLLAQSAERVLAGDLPHRDFDDAYTGGLSYLDAAAFRLLGTDLRSLRLLLLAAFAAWVPAVYYVASRFLRPLGAGAATLLAVAWSVPNYPAGVPSWYNLFLAVFGVAAALRYRQTGRGVWLGVAGLVGGLSILIKVAGLYYVAAILLWLTLREQNLTARASGTPGSGVSPYRVLVAALLAGFVTALVALEQARPGWPAVAQFVLPGAALAGFLLWSERGVPARASRERFLALARLAAPFLVGVAIPIGAFSGWYLRAHALGDLVSGVFIRPAGRFAFAAADPPAVLPSLFAGVPLAMVLIPGLPRWGAVPRTLALAGLAAGLASVPGEPAVYRLIWYSVWSLVPIVALVGTGLLVSRRIPDDRREPVFLLLAVTSLAGLVQFPFSAPIYVCYVAPLAVLAAASLVSASGGGRFPAGAAAVFYCAFAVLFVNRSSLYDMGRQFRPDGNTARLALPRGGIRVTPAEKEIYEGLVSAVGAHAAAADIYATPDCPEVYFLTGRRNPTRYQFEFLASDAERTGDVPSMLDARGIKVVVLNRRPWFSGIVDPPLTAVLTVRFPGSARFGFFVVRWRT